MAERHDVQPALKKLWKKHYKVDGQVTQMLSPFEQSIISPMMKDMPAKIMKRVTEFLIEAGPGLGCGLAVFFWAEWKFGDLAYHHRA
eukprot:CAMPEP_0173181938 /NCGR_PEP_ID=MMETSP1141-20130122/7557_1 /TAXON_ID=483371 /ORGANISM="non described non described, Strain CCMP2298" /LENGTH=86 /DNA_ID=CAMNT_0014104971 /DNA_START=75 /DNA_END=335 /DNA_ORIENTATION=-